MTKKYIVCVDHDERYDLANVRILDGDTYRELMASGMGAWGHEQDAIAHAFHLLREHGESGSRLPSRR